MKKGNQEIPSRKSTKNIMRGRRIGKGGRKII
jgi:hypothetical protein